MQNSRVAALALVFATLAVGNEACSSSSNSPATNGGAAGSASIGATGGAVTSTDGAVTLNIPAGALSATTAISVTQIASPGAGSVGEVFDLEPSGTTFATPITLSFSLGDIPSDGGSDAALSIATYANGAWSAVASTVGTATISAQISHFSPWGVITATATSSGATGATGTAGGGSTTTSSDAGTTSTTCTPSGACTTGTQCSGTGGIGGIFTCKCVNSSYACQTGNGDGGTP